MKKLGGNTKGVVSKIRGISSGITSSLHGSDTRRRTADILRQRRRDSSCSRAKSTKG